MRRREFLRAAMMGGATVTMPAFLHGCALRPSAILAEPLPDDPFLSWFGIDRDLIGRVLAVLGTNGADSGEIYFQHRRTSTLRMLGGAVGGASTDIMQGVGLRVIRGETVSFAHTDDLSEQGIIAAARRVAGAHADLLPSPATAIHSAPPGAAYVTEVPWSEVGVGRKLPILENANSLARQADPQVSEVELSWADADERVVIATLDGRLVTDRRPMTRMSAQVTMRRDGVEHSGFADIAARDDLGWYTRERIAATVDNAVQRTAVLFDARRPPSGDMPVILAAGNSGVVLHEAIGHALEADFVRDGKSPYGAEMNNRVAGQTVTIVDQGTLPNERGALNYDDEGAQCKRNVLIEDGVLRSFLHDQLTARQFAAQTTASGRRESYRHAPMPRMTCTFVENGPHEPDELVAAMGRGIVVDTITGGNVSLGDGAFRFNVKNAWLVEKGKRLMPLRDFTIAGSGPAALSGISMVANNLQMDRGGWSCGKLGQTVPVSQGMPSVLIGSLSVNTPS